MSLRQQMMGCAAALVLFALPLFAHHGVAHYDMKKTIDLAGTVSAFDWSNPHCLVHLDVQDSSGQVRHWTLEMASTSSMARMGWDKDTLKPGDQVTTQTHPAQNGNSLGISAGAGFALKFVVNGREVVSQR